MYKGASISGVLKNAKIPMEKVEFDATANNPSPARGLRTRVRIFSSACSDVGDTAAPPLVNQLLRTRTQKQI